MANSASSNDDCYPSGGKGLCIIIANFYGNKSGTKHLQGYMEDHKSLKDFFETKLKFDVMTCVGEQELINLSYRQFTAAMGAIKNHLNNKLKQEGQKYDKFVMFVLSHGGQHGVCMCKENSQGEKLEYDEDGNPVFISVEEIINSFTHDNIPKLEGIPKCFIFQACRGQGYVQPADTNAKSDGENSNDMVDKVIKKPSIKRANVFVAYATLEYKNSWVDSVSGSWFIRTIVDVMRDSKGKDDIFEMLTKVIRIFSEKSRGNKFHPVNHSMQEFRVHHNGKLRPLIIYGKLIDVQFEDDKIYTEGFGMPLHPNSVGNSYIGFAPCRQTRQLLQEHTFSGKIAFRKTTDAFLNFSSISGEHLKAFQDARYFDIYGHFTNKTSEKRTAGDDDFVEINGDTFEVLKYKKPKRSMETHNLKITGIFADESEPLDESKLVGMEAELYIEDQLYSIGKLEKGVNGVLGIYAPIYQLPVVSSTLTRKMYLTEPVIPQEEDSIDGAIEMLNRLKCKGTTSPALPVEGDQPVEGPKTDLDSGTPEIEILNAGAKAPERKLQDQE